MVLQKGKRMNIPSPCQTAAHEVETIQSQLQDLQDELVNAVGSKKVPLDQQLHRASAELTLAQNALNSCLEQAQIPLPLEATFTGAFLVKTTNARARGPFKGTLTVGCSFSADRTRVTLTRFPPISVGPIRVPVLGLDTVTATRTGGGSGSSTSGTGAMSMRIVLLFHHSLIIRFYPLDSTLSLLMDTGTHTSPSGALRACGSPMDAQGMVTFAGVGVFSRGYLAGDEASIVLAGQIAPHPYAHHQVEKP
jgi:hypothetical protein